MAAAGETDVCGICLETLPRWAHDFKRFACCGKGLHKACTEELQASAHGDKCPMCRAPKLSTGQESHSRTLKWAERGKGWAMYMVASDYFYGCAVQKSQKTARLWYGRAAEQGYALAQYNLANMHENGQGGPVSMEQARVWYGRAAEQGHTLAQYNLGAMHYEGHGGPVSLEHATFWFKRAAAQGDNKYPEAMHIVQQMKSICSSCGKPRSASGGNMKSCSGCKCAIYCSKVCQRAHWKKDGGHKTMCKKIQALHLKMAGGASGSLGSAAGGAGGSKRS